MAQTVKKSSYSVGDLGLIPGLGRSPGGGHGNPLQYSFFVLFFLFFHLFILVGG